jgi:hypothetical protein
MATRMPPPFEPRKLRRRELEVPITPALKRLPGRYRDELQGRRQELIDSTSAWRGRNLERLRRYALGGAAFFPLAAGLLWFHRSAAVLLAMPFLGAAYGALVVLLRPSVWVAGALCWMASLALLLLDGQMPFAGGLGFIWFYHLAIFSIGMAVGATADG